MPNGTNSNLSATGQANIVLNESLLPQNSSKKSYFAFGQSHLLNAMIASLYLLRFYCVIAVLATKDSYDNKTESAFLKIMPAIFLFPLFLDTIQQLELFGRAFLSIAEEMDMTKEKRSYFSESKKLSLFATVKTDSNDPNAWSYVHQHKKEEKEVQMSSFGETLAEQALIFFNLRKKLEYTSDTPVPYTVSMNSHNNTLLYDQVMRFIEIRKEMLQAKFQGVPNVPPEMRFTSRYLTPYITPEHNFASKSRECSPLFFPLLLSLASREVMANVGPVLFWMMVSSIVATPFESFLLKEQEMRFVLSGMQRRVLEFVDQRLKNCVTRSRKFRKGEV
jgi:hypothetical protein